MLITVDLADDQRRPLCVRVADLASDELATLDAVAEDDPTISPSSVGQGARKVRLDDPVDALAEDAHVALAPVGVIVAPAFEVLEEVGVVGHRMSDHVLHGDPVALLEPGDEVGRRHDLGPAIENRVGALVASAELLLNHLDPEGDVIEADRMAAAHVQAGLLVDRAILVDDELGADPR